jgi:hypothetical protein
MAIALGDGGTSYVTGYTGANSFPTTLNAYDLTWNGAVDVFIAVLDTDLSANSSLLYATYIGGGASDVAQGIGVDASGRVYVSGLCTGGGFPVTPDAHQTTMDGAADGVVLVLNPAGMNGADLIYATYVGGDGVEECHTITVDASNNFYVAGHTSSGNFDTTGGAYDGTLGGTEDAFVVKFTPVITYQISGRIFEDAVIAGGTGEPFDSGEGDTGIPGARIELFDAADAFLTAIMTDGAGGFAFASLGGNRTYKVRVPVSMLNVGLGLLGEQTFESDGTSNYGGFGAAMGGENALVADTATQSTLTGAEHWVAVPVAASDVAGVDLGFSYELITNTNDAGQGSLRQFLGNANLVAGVQTSRFNIPTTDPNYSASPLSFTIQPQSALPAVADTMVIDGTTQLGFASTPIIVLDGTLAGPVANGLEISADGCIVRGLVINQFSRSGVRLSGDGNVILGNFIGTDVTGLLYRGNGSHGILIDGGGNNVIGGTAPGDGNLIASNLDAGIAVTD